jgi:hypothetical protein
MSEMETQLRILMNIAASEPPHRLDAQIVRRSAIRRRVAAAVASAAAIALIGGLGAVVSAWASGSGSGSGPGSAPVSSATVPPGVPRHYIESSGQGPAAAIRATATGAVTGSVRCPLPGYFAADFAAADHQTFFLLCELPGTGTTNTVSRIYRFTVTAAGKAGHLTPVRNGVISGGLSATIAASPDGSEVAVTADASVHGGVVDQVFVFTTRTGATAVLSGAPHRPGMIRYQVLNVSFTQHGDAMIFLTRPHCVPAKGTPKCHVGGGEQIRMLQHPQSGGRLSDSHLLLRQAALSAHESTFINGAVISPDGSLISLVQLATPRGRGQTSVAILQLPLAALHGPARILYTAKTGNGFSFSAFNVDPSGRHFLLDAGRASRPVNGWISNGKLIRLKPDSGDVRDEAW